MITAVDCRVGAACGGSDWANAPPVRETLRDDTYPFLRLHLTMSRAMRQIRALHDANSVTVYQAYSAAIATPAVAEQKLNASPAFRTTRMTWIKPSWCWMMYRSGYSFKDPGQERIIAIRLSHAGFAELLSSAEVRVQWDPERSTRLERLDYRSIQVGIPASLYEKWIGEWIVAIEDVTERARTLKETLENEPQITHEELVRRSLMPEETPYDVPEELRTVLLMD